MKRLLISGSVVMVLVLAVAKSGHVARGELAATSPLQQEMVVPSPMSGLLSLSPVDGGPPFVKVGDQVQSGTVLAIVDNMPVRAMCGGTVTEVMVEDRQMVTLGQSLFRIRTP